MKQIRLNLLVALAATLSCLAADNHKISQELQDRSDGPELDVIVQYKTAPTARHHKKVSDRGGHLKNQLDNIRGGLYSLPPAAIAELSDDPEVAYISPDRAVHALLDYAEPTVNANIAMQYGFDGTGVGIAVIDSGINTRTDLSTTGSRPHSVRQGPL